MKNFSEKIVRNANLMLFVILLIFVIKNKYFILISIFPLLAYFSSKGIDMFEDRVSIYTRIFFWVVSCIFIFLKIYKKDFYFFNHTNYLIITISIFVGIWAGDLIAKYIYTRIRLFINRLKYENKKGNYKIVSIDRNIEKYLKKPGKKDIVAHNYIIIENGAEEIRMFLDGEIYNKVHDNKSISLNLRKGILGNYFAIYLEE